MLPQAANLPTDQRRLLKVYKQLDAQQQQSLQDFAEFLLQKSSDQASEVESLVNSTPKKIKRPQDESVVKAIKRLKDTFFMLDPSDLFTETSSLMTKHIMQGCPAEEVIDALEVVFSEHYERFKSV